MRKSCEIPEKNPEKNTRYYSWGLAANLRGRKCEHTKLFLLRIRRETLYISDNFGVIIGDS